MEGALRVRDAGAEAVLQDDDRNGGEEDRHDGGIPGILALNGMFSQVCEYAERLGIRLKLRQDVPTPANLGQHGPTYCFFSFIYRRRDGGEEGRKMVQRKGRSIA